MLTPKTIIYINPSVGDPGKDCFEYQNVIYILNNTPNPMNKLLDPINGVVKN